MRFNCTGRVNGLTVLKKFFLRWARHCQVSYPVQGQVLFCSFSFCGAAGHMQWVFTCSSYQFLKICGLWFKPLIRFP